MLEITEIEYSDPDAFTEEELRDYERVFIRKLVTTVLKTVYDIDPEEFREMNPRLTYSQKGVIRRLAEGNTEGFFKNMPMNMIEKEIGPFLGGHKGSRSADRRRVRKTRKVKPGRKTRKGGRRGRKTTHKRR
jgi:hypothetical protein